MTTRYVINLTRGDANALAAAANLLDDYPSRGVDVGGGRHADVQTNWDGVGATPIGWTQHTAVQKPGNGVYRVALPQYTQDRRTDPVRRARLTAQQLALVDGLVLIDVLPPDWVV